MLFIIIYILNHAWLLLSAETLLIVISDLLFAWSLDIIPSWSYFTLRGIGFYQIRSNSYLLDRVFFQALVCLLMLKWHALNARRSTWSYWKGSNSVELMVLISANIRNRSFSDLNFVILSLNLFISIRSFSYLCFRSITESLRLSSLVLCLGCILALYL